MAMCAATEPSHAATKRRGGRRKLHPDVNLICTECGEPFTLYHAVHQTRIRSQLRLASNTPDNLRFYCSNHCAAKDNMRLRYGRSAVPEKLEDQWERILRMHGLGMWSGYHHWLSYGEHDKWETRKKTTRKVEMYE